MVRMGVSWRVIGEFFTTAEWKFNGIASNRNTMKAPELDAREHEDSY